MENTENGVSESLSNAMVKKLLNIGNQIEEVQDNVKKVMVLQEPTRRLFDGVEKMNEMAAAGRGVISDLAQWRDEMNELKAQMASHIEYFRKPAQKEIHHKHFIGKPLVVVVCLLLVMGAMAAGLTGTWQRASRNAAADIKWRYLRARYEWGGFTDSVERWYRDDPNGMEKQVIGDEERRRVKGH